MASSAWVSNQRNGVMDSIYGPSCAVGCREDDASLAAPSWDSRSRPPILDMGRLENNRIHDDGRLNPLDAARYTGTRCLSPDRAARWLGARRNGRVREGRDARPPRLPHRL